MYSKISYLQHESAKRINETKFSVANSLAVRAFISPET